MKKVLPVVALVLVLCGSGFATHMQTGVRVGPADDIGESATPKSDRKKVAVQPLTKSDPKRTGKNEKSSEPQKTTTALSPTASAPSPLGNNGGSATSDGSAKSSSTSSLDHSKSAGTSTLTPAETGAASETEITADGAVATKTDANASATSAAPLTSIYRVGVGDVLDIRLLNLATQESTLYTVMAGGLLEYPLAGEPFVVEGKTTDEISARLTAELKRRAVYEKPQVVISVRQYMSHSVIVSGLVEQPGAKLLRREAVPLYVILAEAAPRAEAGLAVVISRATGQSNAIDLADPVAVNLLIQPGDVINVTARPPQFFYIGGEINMPGQKDFHAGLTLTQAVLASGGTTRLSNNKVRVSRQGPDGRLASTEYNLKDITSGKVPDPRLQAGDRIEIGRKN